MSRSPSLQLLSFRRTFTLLIVLMVLPSAGLSGFGVLAIINERAAVEKRLEASLSGRLATVSDAFALELQRSAPRVEGETLQLFYGGERVSDVPFTWRGEEVAVADARLKPALASLGPEPTLPPGRPQFFSVSTMQGTFLVGAMRVEGQTLGARLTPAGIATILQQVAKESLSPGEGVRVELRPVKRETGGGEGLIGRFVSGVADVREGLGARRELASHALPVPLQDLRLVAVPLGEDPVAQKSAQNRTAYAILLGLFYITLAVGVVYTGRTLYREAKLSRLKTDFVSLISHELRTPLTSIRMFIETLAMKRVTDTDQVQEVLHLLSKETERLSEMIDRVLDWARLESGRRLYHLESVPLAEVLELALAAFRAQRYFAQVTLRTELSPDLPRIDADKDALAGAVLNLLQNAFKYSAAGKPITLRASLASREAVVEVEDEGVGIAPHERKRIFERFYRVDNLLTRKSEGSGLGLPISRRIVEAHGGTLSLKSAPGKGSTFTIKLPLGRTKR